MWLFSESHFRWSLTLIVLRKFSFIILVTKKEFLTRSFGSCVPNSLGWALVIFIAFTLNSFCQHLFIFLKFNDHQKEKEGKNVYLTRIEAWKFKLWSITNLINRYIINEAMKMSFWVSQFQFLYLGYGTN